MIRIPAEGYIRVKVMPKSRKTELKEVMQGPDDQLTYKICVKAAPEKGKANAELIKFLSKELNIPKGNISIISGKTDQLKLLKIKK